MQWYYHIFISIHEASPKASIQSELRVHLYELFNQEYKRRAATGTNASIRYV